MLIIYVNYIYSLSDFHNKMGNVKLMFLCNKDMKFDFLWYRYAAPQCTRKIPLPQAEWLLRRSINQ